MKNKQKITVKTNETLVSLGSSQRLVAMRQSLVATTQFNATKNNLPILNEAEQGIQYAQALIQQRISAIKSRYPQGKQGKFFALRYATEEKLRQMTLQDLFVLLNIQEPLAHELKTVKYTGKYIKSFSQRVNK